MEESLLQDRPSASIPRALRPNDSDYAGFKHHALEVLALGKGRVLLSGLSKAEFAVPGLDERLVTRQELFAELGADPLALEPGRSAPVLSRASVKYVVAARQYSAMGLQPKSALGTTAELLASGRRVRMFHPLIISANHVLYKVAGSPGAAYDVLFHIARLGASMLQGKPIQERKDASDVVRCRPGGCVVSLSLLPAEPGAGRIESRVHVEVSGYSILEAMTKAMGDISSISEARGTDLRSSRLMIALSYDPVLLLDSDTDRINYYLVPSMNTVVLGLGASRQGAITWTPVDSFLAGTETGRRVMDRVCKSAGRNLDCWTDPKRSLRILQAVVYQVSPGGRRIDRILPPKVDAKEMDRLLSEVDSSIETGLDYLARNQARNESFLFRLEPVRNEWLLTDRLDVHALVTYCGLEALEEKNNDQAEYAMARALHRLLAHRYCTVGRAGGLSCTITDRAGGYPKDRTLPATAATLLALLTKHGRARAGPGLKIQLRQLAAHVAEKAGTMNDVSGKADAEAKGLALLSLSSLAGRKQEGPVSYTAFASELIARAKDLSISLADSGRIPEFLAFIPWVIMSADRLFQASHDQALLDEVLSLYSLMAAKTMITPYRNGLPKETGWFSASPDMPELSAAPALAAAASALHAASRVAPFKVDALKSVLARGTGFLLGLQYRRQGLSCLLSKPWISRGGFRVSPGKSLVRSKEHGLALLALSWVRRVLFQDRESENP